MSSASENHTGAISELTRLPGIGLPDGESSDPVQVNTGQSFVKLSCTGPFDAVAAGASASASTVAAAPLRRRALRVPGVLMVPLLSEVGDLPAVAGLLELHVGVHDVGRRDGCERLGACDPDGLHPGALMT